MATGQAAVAGVGAETASTSASNQNQPSWTTPKQVVNDFSIQVATVNGSGSQSANIVLLRSIFRMGIPVSGKNLFPSNIAGLPTWYTIRASKHGYLARRQDADVLVALNPETARGDILAMHPGSVALVEDTAKSLLQLRDDLVVYPVPFTKITADVCPVSKLRKLVKNMVYVGVLAKLLGLDLAAVERALRHHFASKPKAADLNWVAIQAGYEYAAKSLTKTDPYVFERMHATDGKIIIDGNQAIALGAMFAGVTVVGWYPITPSTSVIEQLSGFLKKYRVDKDGKATFAVIQAEDELAAAGMVLGAGWAGARAMTSTSGPGISLMSEFIGLGYFAELPGVFVDIERVGPSTGLPTRTSQGDLLTLATLSHGDTKHVVLLPGSVKECFELTIDAFDLTERLQTPVFIASDLDLGMNHWMSDPFQYPEKPIDRGKVLTAEDLKRLGSFGRYKDVDGDGIPYRTIPGIDHPKAAYFTRGTGHDESALYSEKPEMYVKQMERLVQKLETAKTLVPKPIITQTGRSKIGIIAYGTSDFAVLESRDQLKKEYGIEADYLRVRAYPFTKEVIDFVHSHERVYVVDQNRDAQMLTLLKLDVAATEVTKLRSIRHFDGMPIDARSVTDALILQEDI